MITGYQRQHRKSIAYTPTEGADPQTTDQYTKLITHVCNKEGIHEQFSKACELSAITGFTLLQPYLDYSDDAAQGTLKTKVWEYNSFLVDPYFRNPDMSDAQFVWCQEYISKKEAEDRFPDKFMFLHHTQQGDHHLTEHGTEGFSRIFYIMDFYTQVGLGNLHFMNHGGGCQPDIDTKTCHIGLPLIPREVFFYQWQ